MRIKKRLQINIAISFLTVLVICLVLLISLYRLNKSNESENIADDIMTGSFERVALKNDYIRNNSDRAKEQWYAKHEQVGKVLKSAMENFRGAEEGKNVAGLIEAHEAIGRIFSAIVANRDRRNLNPASADLSHEVEERLLNQLNMRVYEVVILSRQLLKLSTEERDSALRMAGGGVLFALLSLVASAMLHIWIMSRTITPRLLRLRDGASMIGEGDLDHRIDVKGDDEFTELSEAFNAMTTKLRVSYNGMENEIEERKRVEMEREELLRSIEEKSGQLEAILANMAEAVGIWSADGALVLVNDATVKLYGFETKGQMLKHLSEYADIKVWTLDGRELPQEEWPPSRALRGETFSNWWLKQEVPSRGLRFVGSNSGAPVRDANGKIVLAVITLHNVTELYESQEAVKQSQKTFAELIERSPFGTYVVDSQFRIAMMNASSQEGAFSNVRPIIGRPFDEAMRILWPEPVALEIIGNFRHTLDTGEPYYSRDFIKPRHDTEIVESYEWELHRMTLPDGQQGVICYYYDSTKLRQAEAALAAAHRQIESLINNTPAIVYAFDLEERFLLVNTAVAELFNTTPEQMIGKRRHEFMPKEDADWHEANDRKVFETGAALEFEEHSQLNDRLITWMTTKFPLRDAQGNIYAVGGISTDVSQRKRMEEAQGIILQRLQTLVASMRSSVLLVGAEDQVVFANQAFCDYFGLQESPADLVDIKANEMIGKIRNAYLHSDEEVVRIRKIVSQRQAVIGEELIMRDGRSCLRDFIPISVNGKSYGRLWQHTDITERKQAEEALRTSEQKYRNLFENMAEEVHFWQIIRDEDGRIKTWRLVDANPPTLKAWGRRTAEEVRGKTTDEIFGPGATEHYRPIVEKIMTEGIPYSFEDYFPNLGKYFRFTSVPLGDYFITTGADITVIKQAQESLKAALAEKEVLLKEIHHRVKNNMQVISSLVSLQADQLQDADMRAILNEMAQRVRSMAMVHEKLYQSHNLAGVEFSDYATSLLNYLWRSHATAASAVRLTLDLEPVSLTVNTAVPCGLILNELVSNALKHAFRGRNGGEVTVSLRSARGVVRLSVRDDGTGLPAGFDWKQAKSLGLRLVQMLAGQLHADVEVSSDRGTEFTIAFEEQKT